MYRKKTSIETRHLIIFGNFFYFLSNNVFWTLIRKFAGLVTIRLDGQGTSCWTYTVTAMCSLHVYLTWATHVCCFGIPSIRNIKHDPNYTATIHQVSIRWHKPWAQGNISQQRRTPICCLLSISNRWSPCRWNVGRVESHWCGRQDALKQLNLYNCSVDGLLHTGLKTLDGGS